MRSKILRNLLRNLLKNTASLSAVQVDVFEMISVKIHQLISSAITQESVQKCVRHFFHGITNVPLEVTSDILPGIHLKIHPELTSRFIRLWESPRHSFEWIPSGLLSSIVLATFEKFLRKSHESLKLFLQEPLMESQKIFLTKPQESFLKKNPLELLEDFAKEPLQIFF